MRYIIFAILITAFQFISYSQTSTEDYLGSWYTYGSNHRLNERFSINPYAELRFYEASSNYNLAFVSIRGNYHFKKNQSIGFGYAYLNIDTLFEFDEEPNVHEHRLFQQYTKYHRLNTLKLSHRGRLEQRFQYFTSNSELQNRFRYKIQARYDINKTLFLVVSEEPFVNFQDQVFHENRFYTGLGINFLKNSQLQIGYLKQHIRKNNLNRIQMGISIQTDARKQNTIVHL
ncbi:DUF2490 domain-containing protein [Winogradskyella sp. KYW1333]|uniref:DUF2490 domain-containing protein n=1 Tax=Winogradskyella sp. KYW1333 TaxID=2282123 RepID=UPI000DF20364|nr:DUF2490 domain-containing protein [Winogradskyella sp. KYW1333]RCT54674.1 DUF2490 domain-containing protein [Winogradskyella sp. KYW1333]